MAFQFTTGTINQPDAGSVGLAMVEKIRDDLVAHAAWDLVEEFTPGSGLVRWYVFKCLASSSGLPADFFVVIGRTLGSGELRFFICEAYNSTTHVATQYCVANQSNTSFTYDSIGRVPVTNSYTLGTAVIAVTYPQPMYNVWTPSGTSTKWWLIVTDDGFTVAFNGAANGVVHCGTYISLSTLTNVMPIHIFGNLPPASWSGHTTRNPALAGLLHYGAGLQTFCAGTVADGPFLGASGELRYNDALQGGARAVAEQSITISQVFGVASTEGYVKEGWLLGKVKRMRANSTTAPAGFAFGDAYVLQGRLWVPYLPTDGRMWDTGVAA